MGVVQEAYGFTITAVQSSLEFKRPHCGRFKSHLRDGSIMACTIPIKSSSSGMPSSTPPMVAAHQAEVSWQKSDRFRRPRPLGRFQARNHSPAAPFHA